MNILITDAHPITAMSRVKGVEYTGSICCTNLETAVNKYILPRIERERNKAVVQAQGNGNVTMPESVVELQISGGNAQSIVNRLWEHQIRCVNNNITPGPGTLVICYYNWDYVLVLDLTTGYGI